MVGGGNGTGNAAPAGSGSAQPGGDASDSFPAWLRRLAGNDAEAASEGEFAGRGSGGILEPETTGSEAFEWDQLMAMIADAMESLSELTDDGQTLNGIDISTLQDALRQLANTGTAMVEGHSLQALADLVMDSKNGSRPATEFGGKAMAAVQEMTGIVQEGFVHGKGATGQGAAGTGQEGHFNGQGVTASGALAENDAKAVPAAGKGIAAGELDLSRDEANPAEAKQSLQTEQNRQKTVSPVDPTVTSADDTVDGKSPEVSSQRMQDGKMKAVRGDDPFSPQKDSQQTRQSLSVPGGKNGSNSSLSDENSPDNRRAVRSEIQDTERSADTGEKELTRGAASSESAKTAGLESNRFSDTVQEVTRTAPEKSGTAQTAPSERAEAPAAQRFQTTVMDQIVDRANLRSIQGRSEIQIRLKPDFLGNVQMNIVADKEQLVVRMVTDQPVVKEIVEANLHHLKTELQHQGLTIDRFEVVVNPDTDPQQNREQFSQMFKNPSYQNGRRQGSDPQPETNDRKNGILEDDPPADAETDGVNYFA
jgi:flagellar hook-length control protein FliK